MAKYEIIKNSKDNYTLKYKDQSLDFKTDVSLISKMQGVHKKARINMVRDLSLDGVSVKNLSIEYKKDGKTYIDNSNKAEMEEIYIGEAMAEFMDDVCKEKLGKTYVDLIQDMDLDEQDIEKFSVDLLSAFTGSTPSGK